MQHVQYDRDGRRRHGDVGEGGNDEQVGQGRQERHFAEVPEQNRRGAKRSDGADAQRIHDGPDRSFPAWHLKGTPGSIHTGVHDQRTRGADRQLKAGVEDPPRTPQHHTHHGRTQRVNAGAGSVEPLGGQHHDHHDAGADGARGCTCQLHVGDGQGNQNEHCRAPGADALHHGGDSRKYLRQNHKQALTQEHEVHTRYGQHMRGARGCECLSHPFVELAAATGEHGQNHAALTPPRSRQHQPLGTQSGYVDSARPRRRRVHQDGLAACAHGAMQPHGEHRCRRVIGIRMLPLTHAQRFHKKQHLVANRHQPRLLKADEPHTNTTFVPMSPRLTAGDLDHVYGLFGRRSGTSDHAHGAQPFGQVGRGIRPRLQGAPGDQRAQQHRRERDRHDPDRARPGTAKSGGQ